MPAVPDWYAPIPSELPATRMTLLFRLRRDDRFFRNLVVPQAGGAWFVRQLSWAVAALALRESFATDEPDVPGVNAIAHAIEAVGSKLEWFNEVEKDGPRSLRALGRRAFARDGSNYCWSFEKLSRVAHYVQNTRRQSSVRPLSSERGLGLAVGARYGDMRLVGLGVELAEAFLAQRWGQGGGRMDAKLRRWTLPEDDEGFIGFLDQPGALEALGPSNPSGEECRIVARALYQGSDPASETRRSLGRVFQRHTSWLDADASLLGELRAAGRTQQAREIEAARAFGDVLDAIVDLALAASAVIEANLRRTPLPLIDADARVRGAFELLREKAARYLSAVRAASIVPPSANGFAEAVGSMPRMRVVADIMTRAPDLFDVGDGGAGPGDLFRKLRGIEQGVAEPTTEDLLTDDRPPELSRAFALDGFHELARDCLQHGEGSP